MATDNLPTARRFPGALRIALFVSLAFNLMIVGMAVGFVLRGGPDGAPPRSPRAAVAPLTEALSRQDRREIGRRLFKDLRREKTRAEYRAQALAEHEETLRLLRAQPFDAGAFETHLTRQNTRAGERQKQGQALLVGRIAQMSSSERAEFADRVAENLNRRGKKYR